MTKQERYSWLIEYFLREMPVAETELTYSDPYQLIVSVILSAQCTDKRVNLITPALFNAYATIDDMAQATPDDIFPYIRSCTYPNSKAKYLAGMAKMLKNEFHGKVPADIKLLQKLPGVGRKSANVIASVIFKLPYIAVDTHVFRVSARLGLTSNTKTPVQTEEQLVKYIPENLRPIAHHWLILHGRYTCIARKPLCERCGLTTICKFYATQVNN